MPARTVCPMCSAKLVVPDRLVGRAVRCPKCKNVIPAGPASAYVPLVPPAPAPEPALPPKPVDLVPDRRPPVSAPKSIPPQSRCIIIGPTSCGKTSLLSALKMAADQPRPGDTQYTVRSLDDRTLDFFVKLSGAILRTGRIEFPGTMGVSEYRFALEQVSRGWFGNNRSTYEFLSIDTQGGKALPKPEDSTPPDPVVIAATKASESLILLVDAADQKAAGTFFVSLQPFLARAVDSDGKLNVKRVAIILTKADVLVGDQGASARAELERMDPWRYALDSAIGIIPIRHLLQYLRPECHRAVRCGWASVYGFIPEDGAVNVVSTEDGDRLAVYNPHEASWVNQWHPYQVLDPFVFAATGNPMGLKPLPDTLLRGL